MRLPAEAGILQNVQVLELVPVVTPATLLPLHNVHNLAMLPLQADILSSCCMGRVNAAATYLLTLGFPVASERYALQVASCLLFAECMLYLESSDSRKANSLTSKHCCQG